MRIKILVFPGINREKDMADAFEGVTGKRPDFVWHKDSEIGQADLIVVPGGFSYGDYLRCGAMAAQSPIIRDLKNQAEKGVRVFGVCNGFQILTETGLLPGGLMRNRDLKFICKHIHLKTENGAENFTRKITEGSILRVPVAHGEGNYFTDDETLNALNSEGRIAFRYCDESGAVNENSNPNGSSENIAGIYNKRGTILGMMPHPEDAVDLAHGGTDGRALFESIVEALA